MQPMKKQLGTGLIEKQLKHHDSIHSLNLLLQHEIAAKQAYLEVMENLKGVSDVQLNESLAEHLSRLSSLKGRILEVGGHPATTPGAWEIPLFLTTGNLPSCAPRMPLPKVLMITLEVMEQRGVSDYRTALGTNLDSLSRLEIDLDLYPGQVKSLNRIVELMKSMNQIVV